MSWPEYGGNGAATQAPKLTKFTTNGTWTPDPAMVYAIAQVQAGGGSAGSINGTGSTDGYLCAPGSSGSYAEVLITAEQAGASQAVVVGAGGISPVNQNNGTNGGASSIGTLVSCPGGQGGSANNGIAAPTTILGGDAPSGPTVTGCTLIEAVQGMAGGRSAVAPGTGDNIMSIGAAGSSPMSTASSESTIQVSADDLLDGVALLGYGGGGWGRVGHTGFVGMRNGGNGLAGIVVITEYF